MITDKDIKDKLERKESRELLTLIRTYHIPGLPFRMKEGIEKYFEQLETELKEFKNYPYNFFQVNQKKNKAILRIKELYSKVSDDLNECVLHWDNTYREQEELHKSYNRMAKPPKQDNKTYYAKRKDNDYSSNSKKIRLPRKKRKTAWKRFEKLFPNYKAK